MPVAIAAVRLAALAILLLPTSHAAARNGTATVSPKAANFAGKPHRGSGRRHRPREAISHNQVGLASWYGGAFHGRRTASGEIFDMDALTAAHRTLPLATVVRVSNLDNGRSVTVRINDRGPFTGNRVIDLSRAGARALGFARQGTARVRVLVLGGATLEARRGTGVAATTSARRGPAVQRLARRPRGR
jgi:rare lipoprotein A